MILRCSKYAACKLADIGVRLSWPLCQLKLLRIHAKMWMFGGTAGNGAEYCDSKRCGSCR